MTKKIINIWRWNEWKQYWI